MEDKGNVLVVGAQTAAGQAYVEGLGRAGYRVWAPLRPLDDPRPLREIGARPVTVNMLDPHTIRHATSETMAVIIALGGDIGGIGGTEELVTARFIEAARAESVHHIVFSSALHADPSSFLGFLRERGLFEELVVESGLPYTILRPAPFMEALTDGPLSPDLARTGVVQSPIAGDTPVSYLAARDLGRLGVLALENALLNCQTVEVGGPEPVTLRGLLPWLSAVLHRPLAYKEIPLRKMKRRLGEHGTQLIAHINREGYGVDMTHLRERLQLPLADVRSFVLESWGRAAGGLLGEPQAEAAS